MNLSIPDLLKVMESALPIKGCVYLSTPITGGSYRVDYPEDIAGTIQYNAARAIQTEQDIVNDRYYDPYGPIINPARTFISGFTQEQYLELWTAIIKKFVGRLWLMPDFYYSAGCVVEADLAFRLEIPISLIQYDFRMFDDGCFGDTMSYDKELSRVDFLDMVTRAIPTLEESGLSTESHRNVQ